MTKQELQKKYQEIVLKTNGGNDDYVVALCQIGNAINELEEPLQELQALKKELKIWKEVARMACDDEYWSCPNPPERYNLQDEYGSDEPYWVQEGGCEFQDHCNECRMNAYYNKVKKKVEEQKNET